MKTLTLLAVCLALLGGCATVNTVENADKSGARRMISDKQIITDGSLRGIVDVLGVNTAVVGDLLKVQVEVRNKTRGVKNFSYRVDWFDENGMAVTATSPWHSVSIEGGARRDLILVAPTPTAKDFRVSFMESVRMSGTIL